MKKRASNWRPSEDKKLKSIVKNASSISAGLIAASEIIEGRTLSSCQNRWSRLAEIKRNRKPKRKIHKRTPKTVVSNRTLREIGISDEKEAFYVDTITILMEKLSNSGKLMIFKKLYELK